MSPRSAEYMAEAHRRLRTARAALGVDDPSGAVSAAYYAMLYAARAALSEEDRSARTHAGAWGAFRETFVTTGRFPEETFRSGPYAQELREAADYHARSPAPEVAESIAEDAERFVAAISEMLGDD
ncbi:MAG: HEPN domain-containing protein [Solirubrobacterales bacterium]